MIWHTAYKIKTQYNQGSCLQYSITCKSTVTTGHFFLQNVNISFINNTAGHAGAALYVSDVRECSFTATVSQCRPNVSANTTEYDRSIFPGPPFSFR